MVDAVRPPCHVFDACSTMRQPIRDKGKMVKDSQKMRTRGCTVGVSDTIHNWCTMRASRRALYVIESRGSQLLRKNAQRHELPVTEKCPEMWHRLPSSKRPGAAKRGGTCKSSFVVTTAQQPSFADVRRTSKGVKSRHHHRIWIERFVRQSLVGSLLGGPVY